MEKISCQSLNEENLCGKDELSMSLREDIHLIMKEYNYDYAKVSKLLNLEPKLLEEWLLDKKDLSESELHDIESKVDEFILSNEYKDCSGLLFLQDLVFPNPPNGNYGLAMTYFLSSEPVKEISPRTFKMLEKSFNYLVCQVLQKRGLLKIEYKGYDVYKLTITRTGLAYLIRDWIKLQNGFNEFNYESINFYLSKVRIKDE